MIVRIKIAIPQSEYSALLKLALTELRTPENQLHFILREALERHGMSSSDEIEDVSLQDKSTSTRKVCFNEPN
jgi:hypothetical protein